MFVSDKWKDYELIDADSGERLERWGDVYLRRPDPQAIWPARDPSLWRKAQDGSLLKEEAPEADLGLAVASLVGARISSPAALVMLLEDLLRGRFGHVVRAKGTVESSGGRLRFDVAGGQYCLSGADSDENQAQAVFIGKALDKTALYKALEAREAGHQGFTLEPFGS